MGGDDGDDMTAADADLCSDSDTTDNDASPVADADGSSNCDSAQDSDANDSQDDDISTIQCGSEDDQDDNADPDDEPVDPQLAPDDDRTDTDSDAGDPINPNQLLNIDLQPLGMPEMGDSNQITLIKRIFAFKERYLSTRAYQEFAGTTMTIWLHAHHSQS